MITMSKLEYNNRDSSSITALEGTLEVTPASATSLSPELEEIFSTLVKSVNSHTRRAYTTDARYFLAWLRAEGRTVETANFATMMSYHAHLADTCKPGLAARRFTVARRLLHMAVKLEFRTSNPAEGIPSFKPSHNETTHTVLRAKEAKELLGLVDTSTNMGKRDYALLMLLIRTGMRRAEASALTLGDLRQEQGHSIAIIERGKGDKRRIAKLPVDVRRSIDDYLVATHRTELPANAPLFVRFKKGDKPKVTALDGRDIEQIVKKYAKLLGETHLTPHGLRATFVTLALEGGAKLEQVQYAAGHADPRTTERYQKRKLNLDDNATDYVRLG